jgi:nicotinamidase-related amidase
MNGPVIPPNARTSLLIVDVQERLVPAMEDQGDACIRSASILLQTAATFGWKVLFTEQYPRGLGATVSALQPLLEAAGAQRFEKVEFSALANASFASDALPKLTDNVIVVGMEAHICVLQTVADLQARGHQAWVPYDGVVSRTQSNRENGLELIRRCGAVVTNTESLLFGALGRAGTPEFKALSALIR